MWTELAGVGFLLLALCPCTVTVFAAAGIAAVAWSGFSGAMNALTSGIPKPENRAGHFTLLGFCMIATNSIGPLLAGWLFDTVSYRAGFAVLACLTALCVILGVILLRHLSARAADYS